MIRLAAICGAICITALNIFASEVCDTVVTLTDVRGVTVVNTPSGIEINVADSKENSSYSYVAVSECDSLFTDWDLDLPFLKKKRVQSKFMAAEDLCFGFAIPVDAPAGMRQSYDFEWQNLMGARWWMSYHTSLSVGFGLGISRVNLGEGYRLGKDGDRLTISAVLPEEGITQVGSNLSQFGMMIPLKFRQRIGGEFGFALSAILRYNTYTTASTHYFKEGAKYNESYKGLQQQPFTVDFQLSVGFIDAIGAYVKYSPCRPFRHGFGPDFKMISAGIIIGM